MQRVARHVSLSAVLLLTCGHLMSLQAITVQQCQPITRTDTGSHTFPNFISHDFGEYTMHMEMDIASDKARNASLETFYFKEYFQNFPNDYNGRVDRWGEGKYDTNFFSQTYPHLINIEGTTCSAFNYSYLQNFPGVSYWGFQDPKGHIYGPSAVWANAFNNLKANHYNGRPVYWKDGTIRGIDVNIWKACFNKADSAGNTNYLTVTYAISKPTWKNEFKGVAPVQVTIKGNTTQNRKFAYINEVYNYVYFEPKVHDDRVFQIPTGIGCDKMPQARNFTGFPPLFVFKAELYHEIYYRYYSKFKTIEYSTLYYDYPERITTIIDVQGDQRTMQINDFNRGVTFEVIGSGDYSDWGMECNILSITNLTGMDSGIARKSKDTPIIHMKDPQTFFAMNSSYYYVGTKWSRGIKTQIFETVKYNYADNLLRSRYAKVVITYYLAEIGWSEFSETNGTKVEHQFPIRMEMVAYNEQNVRQNNMTLNFFQYDTGDVKLGLYRMYRHIDECFDQPNETATFMVTFKRQPKDQYVVNNLNRYFETALRKQLASRLAISALRFPTIYVDYDSVNIYATVDITDRVPSIARFDHGSYRFVPVTARTIAGTPTLQDCAEHCLGNANCKIFYSCNYGKNFKCYIDSQVIPYIGTVYTKDRCQPFFKNPYATGIEKNLKDTLVSLYADQSIQPITVSVKNYPGATPAQMTYQAMVVERVETDTEDTTDYYKMQLTVDSHSIIPAYADVMNGNARSRDDCASFCNRDKSCESMSYCGNSGKCVLTTVFIDHHYNNTKYFSQDTDCNIFTKPYLNSFHESDGVVTLEPADKTDALATSDTGCAKACLDEKSFSCQTFSWCQDTGACLLYNTSYLTKNFNTKIVSTTKKCALYRRIVLPGFKYDGARNLTGYTGHAILNVDLYSCHQACDKDTDGTCNSYDFCPTKLGSIGDGICIIRHSSHPAKTPVGKLKNPNPHTCFGFQRMKADTNPLNPHPKTKADALKQKSPSGLSSGGMAGLCIGLLIVGLLIGGIVIFFVAGRQRGGGGGSHDGMSISFSKQHDSDS